jgi:hypothetical protein
MEGTLGVVGVVELQGWSGVAGLEYRLPLFAFFYLAYGRQHLLVGRPREGFE